MYAAFRFTPAYPRLLLLRAGSAKEDVMMRYVFVLILGAIIAAACGGAADSNAANANKRANGAAILDNSNLPPGISVQPIRNANVNVPGIPTVTANSNMPKGATPTPGIPSPEEIRRQQKAKPGATPTPGIPSPEELRRQSSNSHPNDPSTAASTDPIPSKKRAANSAAKPAQ